MQTSPQQPTIGFPVIPDLTGRPVLSLPAKSAVGMVAQWLEKSGVGYTSQDSAHGDFIIHPLRRSRQEEKSHHQLVADRADLMDVLKHFMSWIDCGCDPSTKCLETARALLTRMEATPKQEQQ